MTEAAAKPARKRASRKPAVPPAQFSAPPEPEQTVQMPPGFKNGQRVHESTPDVPTLRCVERGGCEEAATQQVVSRPHIRYCSRHGAEFEVRQQYVIDPWELEPIR